jgi:putative SOS response-associated peptidase YedK
MINTITHLDDFLTTIQCDDFAGEWEEQQKILHDCQYENWLDQQEKNYWENLAQRSEGFSCNH